MKLTKLNCPQCNGFLHQERDVFCCTSCGAVFNVDYDEDDVQYTDLVTSADRTKMLLQKDLELIQTQYQLREDMIERERQRKRDKEREQALKSAGKLALHTTLGIILSFALTFLPLGFVFWRVSKNSGYNVQNKAEKFKIVSTAIEKDSVFVENAIAAGRMFEYRGNRRTLDETEDGNDRVANMVGDPQIQGMYLMESLELNDQKICMIYKITYQYEDNGEIKEIYDAASLDNLSVNAYGEVKCDYKCDFMGNMRGYSDKDQLYRESVLGMTRYTATEIEIPEQ